MVWNGAGEETARSGSTAEGGAILCPRRRTTHGGCKARPPPEANAILSHSHIKSKLSGVDPKQTGIDLRFPRWQQQQPTTTLPPLQTTYIINVVTEPLPLPLPATSYPMRTTTKKKTTPSRPRTSEPPLPFSPSPLVLGRLFYFERQPPSPGGGMCLKRLTPPKPP